MRHTTATLLLAAGERLGHASAAITMDTYAHVLGSQARRAGQTIGAALYGGKG